MDMYGMETQETKRDPEYKVAVPKLNLRRLPRPDADILEVLTEGTRLWNLQQQDGDFVKVRTEKGNILTGFVVKSYVEEI